ncbi:hypothetical protein BDF14DRAFT_1810361 [Spinellus fusiger]|nr:hypothetical protein BDF14DRAFT_1810361 [Spinellus fusiger]
MCTADSYYTDASSVPIVLDRKYEDNLSVEILSLFQEQLPSQESYNRRMALVRKIEYILDSEWPSRDITVHLFGSSVNDLGTSHSDVDLCITTQWHGLRNIRVLAKLFRKCGMEQVSCVPNAKVPIVRLFDPESCLACDINVNNTVALQNTKMIKTYVAIDPRVRPFIMVLKHWTKQRLLNDAAYGGTLSTYTWTCIAINFLQMRQPPILPVLHQMKSDTCVEPFFSNVEKLSGYGNANCESLGGLLFAFFRRYALEFDYDHQVVSIRHGAYLLKEEKGWDIGQYSTSFSVEEPFDVVRNLGNSADLDSVKGLRLEFKRVLDLMMSGVSLSTLCTPYKRLQFSSGNETQEPMTENAAHALKLVSSPKPTASTRKKDISYVNGTCARRVVSIYKKI